MEHPLEGAASAAGYGAAGRAAASLTPNRHVIVHQFDPTQHVAGGIAGFVRDMVALAPEGQEIALIGVAAPGDGRLGEWRRIELGGRTTQFLPVAHVRLAGRRIVPHTVQLIVGLLRCRPRLDGTVIHSHRAEVGAVLSLLYPRATHVQFLHGDAIASLGGKTDTFWRFMPAGYAALERLAVRRAATSIVMSSRAAERLRLESPQVSVGRNWFDGRIFRCPSSPPPETFTIGWVGRLEVPKDPLKAVDVFHLLKRRGFNFRAWIAGTGALADDVRQALRERGLDGEVELVGLQTPSELAELLRASHTLLITSVFEGIPRSALEALACGVPVVTTDVGELTSLIKDGETGSIARDGTAEELADLVVASRHFLRGASVARTVAALEGGHVVADIFASMSSVAETTRVPA